MHTMHPSWCDSISPLCIPTLTPRPSQLVVHVDDDSPKSEGITCVKMVHKLSIHTPLVVTSQKRPGQIPHTYAAIQKLGVSSFHQFPLHRQWFLQRASQLVERTRKAAGTLAHVHEMQTSHGVTRVLRRGVASAMAAEEHKVWQRYAPCCVHLLTTGKRVADPANTTGCRP